MSMAEDVKDASAYCANLVRTPRFSALCLDAVPAGRASPSAACDLRLQCRDFARARPGQPAACRARCGCNGGSTCWPAAAMAVSRAIRSHPNCRGRSAPGGCRSIGWRGWSRSTSSISTTIRCRRLAALEGYANDTTSTLFACCARILVRPSEAIDHLARHAGLAYAMIEVINNTAAGHRAPAAVRAAAIPAAARQQPRRGFEGQADPAGPRRRSMTSWRGKGALEDGDVAAGNRAGGGATRLPAAGAGSPRHQADVARRQRSLCAAADAARPHAVGAVARLALTGVPRRGNERRLRSSYPAKAGYPVRRGLAM